jgi:hypothetical protein
MRSVYVPLLMLAGGLTARADFSFTMTQKGGNEQVTKHYLKGQKMMVDRGTKITILDFEAQTMTVLDNAAKTYTVSRFDDLAKGTPAVDITADVKNTGEKKVINGYNASQVTMTMDVDMPQAKQAGMKARMEVELWLSPDVPGGREVAAFYRKNAAHFPMAALGGGNNPSMQQAMAKLQRQMAELDGVPVMEIIRMKAGGGAGGPSSAQMQQMAQARAKLEAMAQQGGPAAAGAQQALARMGAMGSGSGNLFEMTMEAGNFSASAIPDSTFAIPEGYRKSEK